MIANLNEIVLERATVDDSLSDDATLVVMAALEGEASLDDLLNATPEARAQRSAESAESAESATTPEHSAESEPDPEPVGAFLRQISVRGFRGIGQQAMLQLKPTPGLTIVAGRNGSGKSSFAEALEVALTGTTARFSKGSTQWKGAWRNLHGSAAPSIEVALAEERVGTPTVGVDWGSEQFDSARRWVQRSGQKREDVAALGWRDPLTRFRPMLSYDELGEILTGKPSELYEAISPMLGTQPLTAARTLVESRAKELAAPHEQLPKKASTLKDLLASLDDERATRARKLVAARAPSPEAIKQLVLGSTTTDPVLERLRAVLQIVPPDAGALTAAANTLRQAVQQVASHSDAAAVALEQQTALLRHAVELHEHVGDAPCPVCRVGTLDAARVAILRTEITDGEAAVQQLRTVRGHLHSARQAAGALVAASVPTALDARLPEALQDELAAARAAWIAWVARPADTDGELALADHLTSQGSVVATTTIALQDKARAEVAAREDAWTPVAAQLAAYAADLRAWQQVKPQVDMLKAAATWLKANDLALSNERLQPVAEQAKRIWASLRQESNVDIAGLSLAGTTTRRHVEIDSSVDGQPAGGITVLSQGELHALALAIFLPRATLPESPFRFVVLDDPVQAMDPAKVDGLLAVLAELAQDRQVVVFSHDDRLAEAARRGAVEATILEVTREQGSVVSVASSLDPAQRWLKDAEALEHDTRLPEETKRRVLPGLLRLAVEAAARDTYFSRELGCGTSREQVELVWQDAHKTSTRVSLALHGEGRDLTPWLAQRPHRNRALGVCTSAVHTGLAGPTRNACDDVRDLVAELVAELRHA